MTIIHLLADLAVIAAFTVQIRDRRRTYPRSARPPSGWLGRAGGG